MALDGLLLHVINKHLQALCPCKLNKIQNISDEELLFVLRTHTKTEKLVINVHSNTNRIYLNDYSYPSQMTPSNFVMVLRKNCNQAILEDIKQIGFDRILEMSIVARDELGDIKKYKLYVELMGKYSNLVFVDQQGIIIDALKRIPVYENSKRLIHPGAVYTLPDPGHKQDPLHVTHIDTDTSLVKQIYGFSPLLSKEFFYRLNKGQTYETILQELLNSSSLYVYEKDFHALEMQHIEQKPKVFPFMEGFHHLYQEEEQKARIKEQCGDVFRCVEKEKNKAIKKLPKLQSTLALSQDYQKYQEYGDLLFAYMDEVPKEPVIEVPSFERDEWVQIPIDMRYDLKQNANKYYQKYHKLKRSLTILNQQIEACKEDIAYFTQLEEQLAHCSIPDALEIRDELIKNRILFVKKNQKNTKRKNKPNLLCLQKDDFTIFVGKNNLQNHYITHQIARKNDIWFHVKDYHGSHVLLKSEHADEEQIRMCANLAAFYSKSKDSSSVPVNYTTVLNLKKVPGAKTGFVTMKTYKTIYIDPQEAPVEQWIQEYKKV